jgi:2-dehydro-3-deoxyphosphogluconate aldolase/(4S)-4-hydroxy-2-oxoglutarate aldolase
VNKSATLARLREIRIVPIIRASSVEQAIRSVDAIMDGGIACAEITMTVPGAVQALEQVAGRFGDGIVLGAGTVLDPETARICILAGAEFLVTPALNVRTIEIAHRYSKAIFPGALTPTEVLTAWEAGGDAIKVFPANALGGGRYIRSLRGPFPQIEFVPTGGVNLETVNEFLAAGCCAVGVGSELVDAKLLAEGQFDALAERARQFVAKVRGAGAPEPARV